MANISYRVKLYSLDDKQQWIDKGTGSITATVLDNEENYLKVFSEEDNSVLLDRIIISDIDFEKQQETLILWCDKDDNEYALSFQEKEGCDNIWKIICSVQDSLPVKKDNKFLYEDTQESFDTFVGSSALFKFPPIDSNHLRDISQMIQNCQSPAQKEKLSCALLEGHCVDKLLDVFRVCEAEKNLECLSYLCEIFKHIVSFSSYSLFEEMFSKERLFDVVGCFEYDRSAHSNKNYREFLRQNVKYREVLPVLNSALLDKIHQTYRVQYIQDVVLPSVNAMDESVFLSPFLYLNKVSIVNMIQEDEMLLVNVFGLLIDKTTEIVKRKNVLLFLKELFLFAQNLQPTARESFYKKMFELKIVDALEVSMQFNSQELKLAVLEVFNFIVEYSPCMIRKYMLEQNHIPQASERSSLLVLFIRGIINDDYDQTSSSFLALFKLLLNPDNMESSLTKSDKTDFLNYFYKNAVDIMIESILTISEDNVPEKKSYAVILEFLEFCVERHSYHIRNIIIHKDLLRHILKLMKSPYTFLSLSAVRFIKKIIALKDEFYNKYIINGDLFQPIFEAFFKNSGRYNMLDSAILEMFEFIKSEEIKSLCTYIMECYGDVLDEVQYVQTFKCLRYTYERNLLKNKERHVPIYLENSFKSEDNWNSDFSYESSNDIDVSNQLTTKSLETNDNLDCVDMEIDKQESGTEKILHCNSPELQSIVVDRTPIFRRACRIVRPGIARRSLCRKRLVDFDFDDESELEEEKVEEMEELSFGQSKRMRVH